MNALLDDLALKIAKVNIVRRKVERYLINGNSVTSLKLRQSSSPRSRTLVRRAIYGSTGAADSGHSQTHNPALAERDLHMATSDSDTNDARIARIASAIRVIPNFPKPGILFQDITTLLLDPKAFGDTIDLFVERYEGKGISVVAGIEARGFIFGPPIALAIGAKFVPLRKPKKLPGSGTPWRQTAVHPCKLNLMSDSVLDLDLLI